MTYFVTGATGFIGKRLVRKLLARRGTVVYFLVRDERRDKVRGAARVLGGRRGARDRRRRATSRQPRLGLLQGRPQEARRARSSTSSTSPPSTT